jgi:hypothetical protein
VGGVRKSLLTTNTSSLSSLSTGDTETVPLSGSPVMVEGAKVPSAAGVSTDTRFLTLSRVVTRRWLRVALQPASDTRSLGVNNVWKLRSPARNASNFVMIRLPRHERAAAHLPNRS